MGMSRFILFIVALSLSLSGCCSFLISERYVVQPHRYIMAYTSSCKIAVDKPLRDEIKRISDRVDEKIKAGCKLYVRSERLY